MTRADHDAAMDEAIRASGAQYVALAGYMRILTDGFVQGWLGRMLNIHPSLLPKYKGLHTHQRAIDAGDSHGGVSVHLVTPELDDGPILGQTPVAIIPGDTAETLAGRVLLPSISSMPAASPPGYGAKARPNGWPIRCGPAPWPCPKWMRSAAMACPASAS
jgi:folate-dependent phosphoribosylglycinamide formyltransferase PurN